MGEWTDKAKGKVKETVGAATGDRSLEAEGKADTLKGKIKGVVEDVKHAIKDKRDEREAARRDADPHRR
ncbi:MULTISPECIES: CsbD family protein [Corallococcus]|uniref:CsbD family protein n=1 Tax=Corallococcus TaxID=83461 RepID=UPI00117E5828|nr:MULTISPECIES: CsbD family protein [Corallococcus]NBD09995.1 CsbD family protein [Corallococcus silvisoli]TSC20922.1 CsbD family protein [Corallococcus sp. Z5C101001]